MNLSFETVDQFCGAIDLTVEQPVIDLTSIGFVKPFALIYLGSFIRYHNSRKTFFDVRPPTSNEVRTYLDNHRFWERFDIEGAAESRVRGLRGFTSFNDIIDIEKGPYIGEDVGRMVHRLLSQGPVKVNASLMEEITSELVDNFSQHSRENWATCAVQWYPNLRRFNLAIGDCGIGIRSSLATKEEFRYLQDEAHVTAATKAFEAGVGRKAEGGMGLTDVRELMPKLNGELSLSTGNAWVRTTGPTMVVGEQAYDLSGVQIELSIPAEG